MFASTLIPAAPGCPQQRGAAALTRTAILLAVVATLVRRAGSALIQTAALLPARSNEIGVEGGGAPPFTPPLEAVLQC